MITDGAVLRGVANMSEHFYVVMEQGFEYDDQYYTRFEGGSPHTLFTNKKKAEEAALLENLKEFKRVFKEGYLRDYAYDFDSLISEDATEDDLYFEEGIFRQLLGQSAYDWYKKREDVEFEVEPSEEQWKRLMNCFNIQFFYVVEVQKG